MRDAALCGSCHTLYTEALGPHGEKVVRAAGAGALPGVAAQRLQKKQHEADLPVLFICQEVKEPIAITALYGQPREGLHRHVFVGGDFIMEAMLNDHRVRPEDRRSCPSEMGRGP